MWIFLFVVSVILFYIFWTFPFGAPWVPTPYKAARRMLELAGVSSSDVVYDLGSGDGRILILAARDFGAKAVGIEIDPFKIILSRIRIRKSGVKNKVKLKWGNIFKVNLKDATVVTIFLTQKANDKLEEKLKRELPEGARVVSFQWDFKNWPLFKKDETGIIKLYKK